LNLKKIEYKFNKAIKTLNKEIKLRNLCLIILMEKADNETKETIYSLLGKGRI